MVRSLCSPNGYEVCSSFPSGNLMRIPLHIHFVELQPCRCVLGCVCVRLSTLLSTDTLSSIASTSMASTSVGKDDLKICAAVGAIVWGLWAVVVGSREGYPWGYLTKYCVSISF